MAEIKWTNEQRAVIDASHTELLVSASAGSGKTAVLVERIIERVLGGMDIDRMLVVTFTRAAASEMKEKIYARIEKAIEDGHTQLEKQLVLIHHANISTIDSFCQSLVKEHFHEIGIDPDFTILSEMEREALRSETLDELLEEAYASNDPDFLNMAASFVRRDKDISLKTAILSLFEESQSYPWPLKKLSEYTNAYRIEDEKQLINEPWVKAHARYLRLMVEGILAEEKALYRYIEEASLGDIHPYGGTIKSDIEGLEALLEETDDNVFFQYLAQFKFASLSRKKSDMEDAELKENVKSIRNPIKKEIEDLQKQCIANPGMILEEMHTLRPACEELIRLTIRFSERFMEKKKKLGGFDFADIEHFALLVLKDEESQALTDTARQLQDFYEEVMVDEYQDSNHLQEEILSSVARQEDGAHNYFMVGDVKQSIYGFRKARPRIFNDKYNAFPTKGADYKRIVLAENFRSRTEVVQTVNDIFCEIMHKDLGKIEYDQESQLKYGGLYDSNGGFETVVRFADREEEAFVEEKMDEESIGAAVVVKEIETLMKTAQVTDKKTGALRPVTYGDIVILHRNANKFANTYLTALKEADIPARVISTNAYFESREVMTVLSALSVLNNPLNDIALVSVLKHLFFVDDELLAKIRSAKPDAVYMYEALCAYRDAAVGQQEVDAQVVDFFEFLNRMRKKMSYETIYNLLYAVIYETHFYNRMRAMPQGAIRAANLKKLLSLAIEFDALGSAGLFRFIMRMEQLQKYEQNFGVAEDTDEDSVRIMTIHKSKGLEFPVCIVAGLGRSLSLRDHGGILQSDELGMGMDIFDATRRTKKKTLYRKVIANGLSIDEMGENLRLLYVALTRAKEKLVLVGCLKEKAIDSLFGNILRTDSGLSFRMRFRAGSFLELIIPALKRAGGYDIKQVTAEELVVSDVKETIVMQHKRSHIEELCRTEEVVLEEPFVYPYKSLARLKHKYSVSELKQSSFEESFIKMDEEVVGEEWLPDIAVAMEESPYTTASGVPTPAAIRGTAVHRFLECFDFMRLDEPDTLQAQFSEMKEKGLLSEEQADMIEESSGDTMAWLAAFIQSEMAQRMKHAAEMGRLYKEKTFVMGDAPNAYFPNEALSCAPDDMLLVQGIIDAFFYEEDGVVLLDYKTDRVKSGDELRERYQKQMKLYADALTKAGRGPLKEQILYSLVLGEAIRVS